MFRNVLKIIMVALLALGWVVTAAQNAELIEIGQSISGELSSSDSTVTYRFNAREGNVLVITLVSQDFDPLLTLQDSDGQTITSDDDSGGNLASRIIFTVPSDGSYRLLVGGLGTPSGDFTLALNQFETISIGQAVTGRLSPQVITQGYTFEGRAGDLVVISVSSDEFDAFLTLADANGFTLITNDDGGGNRNPRLAYVVPADSTFTVLVTSPYSPDGGDYRLELQEANITTLEIGDTVRVEFNAEIQFQYFRFSGQAGDLVDVVVASKGSIDTRATLISPDGFEIASDDDSGGSGDPLLRAQSLTQDGDYIVFLVPYNPGDEGQATLAIVRSEVASLDDGAQTVELGTDRYEESFQFTGVAGERVRIIVSFSADTPPSPTIDVYQNGSLFTTAYAATVERLALDFIVPEDGPVIVQVQIYTPARVTVALERNAAEG